MGKMLCTYSHRKCLNTRIVNVGKRSSGLGLVLYLGLENIMTFNTSGTMQYSALPFQSLTCASNPSPKRLIRLIVAV